MHPFLSIVQYQYPSSDGARHKPTQTQPHPLELLISPTHLDQCTLQIRSALWSIFVSSYQTRQRALIVAAMNWPVIHMWVIPGLVFHQIVIHVPLYFECDSIPGLFGTKRMDLRTTFLLDCWVDEHVSVVLFDRLCTYY